MAVKNNRRTIITKKILKESLLELLKEKPMSKITIKEICELSDMSRSTFYLHYQDQFALLDELENDIINHILDSLGSFESELNTIDAIVNFLHIVKTNRSTYETFLCKSETKSFQSALIEKVADSVKANTGIEIPAQKKDYLFTFIMYGSLNVITDWINRDFDLSEAELAETIYTACNNIAR